MKSFLWDWEDIRGEKFPKANSGLQQVFAPNDSG